VPSSSLGIGWSRRCEVVASQNSANIDFGLSAFLPSSSTSTRNVNQEADVVCVPIDDIAYRLNSP
jgi:hypothetical protein